MSLIKEKVTKPTPVKSKSAFKKIVSKDKIWMWSIFKEKTYVYYYLDDTKQPYFISEDKINKLYDNYEVVDK